MDALPTRLDDALDAVVLLAWLAVDVVLFLYGTWWLGVIGIVLGVVFGATLTTERANRR